ncbi:MAG: hypothetical protein KBF17_01140 [Candidatus Promineofilum sp.]|nr:hypothetical protein [Promineifilum sp.]
MIKTANLRRVTSDTRFYIDYSWWDESHLDLKTYLLTRLSLGGEAGQEIAADQVDLIDSKTGEVRQVDSFQYLVRSYFNRHGNDLATQSSLVDAVFSVLLANGNEPLTAAEIAERVQRQPDLIAKTFGGPQIYHGIRPLFDED